MKIKLIDRAFGHTPSGGICHFYGGTKLQWKRLDPTKDHGVPEELIVATDGDIMPHYDSIGIALLLEPRELIPSVYSMVADHHHGFDYILTHDAKMLELPNALRYEFGGCWIEPSDVGIHAKSKNVSIIASNKKMATGHKLRQSAIGRLNESFDVYGRGHNPVNKKIEALRDYRFSVVIENTKSDYFFTEKLIDCFATGTIPIYWGMPSIGKFFNPKGMVVFNSIAELTRKLTLINMASEKEYEYRRSAIEENFEICKQYFNTEDRIYKALTGKVII